MDFDSIGTVFDVDLLPIEPPKLVQRPDSLMQLRNDERVSIRCGFRGRPEPGITWLYNGEELMMNDAPLTGNTFDSEWTTSTDGLV